jgi:hypothetical protein
MVERMTSVEIEDVLSSIRRLVTDDLRPKPAADNKLILTPALRVVPDAAPVVEDVEQTLDVDLDADLAAALTEDSPAQVAEGEVEQVVAAEAEVDIFPMFLHHDRRVDLAPVAEETHVGETVTTIGAGIPDEGYEAELGDTMPVPDWPESSWEAPEMVEAVEEAEVISAVEAVADTAGWADEAQAAAVPLPADMIGTAEDDAAEAAALAALAAEEIAQEAGGITELDEDMLREIVRDIIREELQGTLGEKITRNVRKLVRAEINRALITDDLD